MNGVGGDPVTEKYQQVHLGVDDEYHHFNLGDDSSGRPLLMNGRTIAMLDEADRRLGFNLTVIQGSYQDGHGAAASGTTHDGGGVVDIRTTDLSPQQQAEALLVLRQVGFAAWHRTTAQFDEDHFHIVSIGDKDLAPAAQDQVEDYRNGLDGLSDHLHDDGPHVAIHPFDYEAAVSGGYDPFHSYGSGSSGTTNETYNVHQTTGVLSIEQIYHAALTAGFTPQQATTWTAIALAESGGQTGALNDSGEYSIGLWQINVGSGVRANSWGNLHDPVVNAEAAYAISNHGTDMRPWTTTHASNEGTPQDYRTYLPRVEAETGVMGDGRGVGGYDSPLPPPLPAAPYPGSDAAVLSSSYDGIDPGSAPGAQQDSDHDGLMDAFEKAAGTNPHSADSDGDGLSDAYEIGVSHTNPLLADSDGDGLSDSTEVALGTDPTTWDSNNDGISDGVEVRYGVNPLAAPTSSLAPSSSSATGLAPTPSPGTGAPGMPVASNGETDGVLAGQTWATAGAGDGAGAGAGGAGAAEGAGIAGGAAASAGLGGGSSAGSGVETKVERFVDAAVAQRGDQYIYGHEVNLNDPNPAAFDCSELTQWAAHQAGVDIPDGAMYQYLDLKQHGTLMPVSEALKTPGALLFEFSSEPTVGGSRPSLAHVAISLGDGRTIEARGTSYGVNEFSGAGRFGYAGVIPGLESGTIATTAAQVTASSASTAQTATPSYEMFTGTPVDVPVDSDHDGLSDAFEKLAGTNPHSADTDGDGLSDAYEALVSHTDPLKADTDGDGQSDATEIALGTDPGHIAGIAGVSGQGQFAENIRGGIKDSDGDGLSDLFEQRAGLNPHAVDSDGDGLSDSTEIALGTNPNSADTDGDGFSDAFEVRNGMDPLHSSLSTSTLGEDLGGAGSDLEGFETAGTEPDDHLAAGGTWP